MRDEETGTMWSHILGKAMDGKLKGSELELLPGELVDWKSWKTRYPQTTVLNMSRTAKQFDVEMQKTPGKFVLGIHRIGKAAKAYPYEKLQVEQVVNDKIGDEALVVFFDPVSTAATVHSRVVDGRTLSFEQASPGKIKDAETGSLWDAHSGRCVAGDLQGKELRAMVGVPSFRKAWFRFFPESEEYGKKSR